MVLTEESVMRYNNGLVPFPGNPSQVIPQETHAQVYGISAEVYGISPSPKQIGLRTEMLSGRLQNLISRLTSEDSELSALLQECLGSLR